MHSLRVTFLLLIHSFTPNFRELLVAAESVPTLELLPDGLGLGSLGDFEVLNYYEDNDEDVYHIRKRADNNDNGCGGTDCWTYSGLTKEEEMRWSDESQDVEGENSKKRSLQKRGRKDSKKVCLGVLLPDGTRITKDQAFEIESPAWPDSTTLETKYKMVYDIGDPSKPTEKEWYELKRYKEKWPKDVVRGKTRKYDAEHVLEWNLLSEFIEKDKAKGPDSRCAFIYQYYLQDTVAKDVKVQVAKDYNKELKTDSDRLEFEEKTYPYSKVAFSKKRKPRPIDYVGYQWPGTEGGKPPSPWEYELILLQKHINIKKNNVWSEGNLFVVPVYDGKDLKKNRANSETLEALFANRYWEDTETEKKWPDNKGTCKAVWQYNNLMAITNYHNDFYIKEILRAQVSRVAEAWEHLEINVVKDVTWTDSTGKVHKHEYRNLRQEWIDYMIELHKLVFEKLNKSLEDKLKVFGKKSIIPRWDYLGVFRRGDKTMTPPNCGFDKDKKRMQQRINLLIDAKANLIPVDPLLKLDNSNSQPTPPPP